MIDVKNTVKQREQQRDILIRVRGLISVTFTIRRSHPRSQTWSERQLGIASNVTALMVALTWRLISDVVRSMDDINCPWSIYDIYGILPVR